jgi:hypothetical protein
MKTRILLAFALVTILYANALAAVPTKVAGKGDLDKCRSAAQVFGDVYKEWGAVIIATGCIVAVNAGSGGVAMAATLNCIKNAKKYAEAVESMVKFFNAAANNGRWTIGPRRIEWGNAQTGALVSTASRVFISAAPVDKDSITVKVKKVDGKAQADIIICKVDEKGNFVKLAQVEFDKGDDNVGQVITKTVSGVKGHLVQVRIDADSVIKKFEYQLTVSK